RPPSLDPSLHDALPIFLLRKHLPEKVGDGLGQLARTLGRSHRQRQVSCEPMAFDPKLLKEMRPAPQGMFREDGIAEAGLHEPFDGFRVVRFHANVWLDADFLEDSIDGTPHIASFGIK